MCAHQPKSDTAIERVIRESRKRDIKKNWGEGDSDGCGKKERRKRAEETEKREYSGKKRTADKYRKNYRDQFKQK